MPVTIATSPTNASLIDASHPSAIRGSAQGPPQSGQPSNTVDGSSVEVPMLKLRGELSATLHELGGVAFFVVEDPVLGRFFRMGYDEWKFACQLNGDVPLDQAYRRYCRRATRNADVVVLKPERIEPLCRWLIQSGLIVSPDSKSPNETTQSAPIKGPMGLNPFFIKLPLVRPDRFLGRLLPWCRWMFTPWCFAGWLVLCLAGLHAIYTDFSRFMDTARMFLSPNTWLYLWGTWLLLKVVHETAHGIVCKRYGGFVADGGAALILFSPVAYVDVTSTWRFRNRWHRVFTSASGMYVEFAVAAMAALVWHNTQSETLGYVCHTIVMAATITTVLFNANPLMRFDGYYMLSDTLNIPNLYVDGRRFMLALGSRVFLGQAVPVKLPSGWRGILVRVYGLAAAFWRVLVCVSMVIGAGALFHGAGLAIAAFGVMAWLIVPLLKLGRKLMGTSPQDSASRRRFSISLLLLFSIGIGIALMPWPGGLRVPAVVTYEPLENVRAETAGFVDSIHVKTRQDVTAGMLLVTLRNDDLRVAFTQVDRELAQAKIRAQTLHRRREIGQYQAELEQVRALQQRRDHLEQQHAALSVRSPIDGRVVDDDLESLIGLFVDVGTPLVRVASESRKEIHVAIPEAFVESFVESIGQTPRVAIRGESRSGNLGALAKVEPRATVTLRHPALGAHNGGPLPVEANQEDEDLEGDVRLVSPRFHGTITLPAERALRLRDGQLGSVTIHNRHETVARKAYRGVGSWVKNKITLSGY